jgi:hypothetical protein
MVAGCGKDYGFSSKELQPVQQMTLLWPIVICGGSGSSSGAGASVLG